MQQSLELLCLLLIIPDRLILISTEDTNNFKIYRNLTFLYLHSSYFPPLTFDLCLRLTEGRHEPKIFISTIQEFNT